MTSHGMPCWYELSTADGGLADAGGFYAALLGWQVADSGMEGFSYHLARLGDRMAAGLMEMPGMPPAWTIYFEVADAEATCGLVAETGGTVLREPAEIPGTGRFAILSDPQGAVFGILEPAPMEDPQPGAFDMATPGMANWNELMTADPEAALDFYGRVFGWQPGQAMDMGDQGKYHIFTHDGSDTGGMMGLMGMPQPFWMPYFGHGAIARAADHARDLGGQVLHGPEEVPGGMHVLMIRDPQGAHFGLVGPKGD
ncbi:VOC family protein [Paracoccus sp. PARArs4]|uniref:VOC family protein n=1 Tax=Paracoccus sp. PARArs4 TaxID=2853442 RepID=UPI0024A61539|nr:VOC family protein [Paracoccus sp. PARArs4]